MTNEASGASGSASADAAGVESDWWTVAAIAIVAYAAANLLHEGAGHGGACLLTGGTPKVLSSVHFECTGSGAEKIVAAGGTIVNLGVGLACWAASRRAVRGVHWRYFLWLMMAVNLLEGAGYFLFSGVGNIGDWALVIEGLSPAWAWRTGMALAGAGVYYVFVMMAMHELQAFLGRDRAGRKARAKKLCLTPYWTGGILSCVAGLLNPVGMILVAVSAAASSFGGTSGLAWGWQMVEGSGDAKTDVQMGPLLRSRGWIAAGIVVGLVFVGLLGPSLKFHAGK